MGSDEVEVQGKRFESGARLSPKSAAPVPFFGAHKNLASTQWLHVRTEISSLTA
jgi:hypothetical protein